MQKKVFPRHYWIFHFLVQKIHFDVMSYSIFLQSSFQDFTFFFVIVKGKEQLFCDLMKLLKFRSWYTNCFPRKRFVSLNLPKRWFYLSINLKILPLLLTVICHIMACCAAHDVAHTFIKYIKFSNLLVKLWNFRLMTYDIFMLSDLFSSENNPLIDPVIFPPYWSLLIRNRESIRWSQVKISNRHFHFGRRRDLHCQTNWTNSAVFI